VLVALVAAVILATAVSTLAYRAASAKPDGEAAGQDTPVQAPTQQIIVKYKAAADVSGLNAPSGSLRMQALTDAAGVELTYFREMSGDAHVLRLPTYLPLAEVARIAQRLAALPEVEYAEADAIMFPTLSPNDTLYGEQWHYFETYGINAPAAWDITTGSGAINIAVIDTGITDHNDLAGRWTGGYDFITDLDMANDGNARDSDPHDPGDWVAFDECFSGSPADDSSWHGTHVAGTIGAASNNNLGVAGINWVSPIVPVRVLGKCGGTTSDIVDGMRWAAGLSVGGVPANANPAKVMNLSLGGSGTCTSTWQNAVNDINAAGKIVVVAAGNDNLNASGFVPANCNGVITVASTDRGGDKASYSNFGAVVEISAPGGETGTSSPDPAPQNGVLSTLNTGTTTPITGTYVYYQGTSMAAPHVAGVVSLMTSVNPTLVFTNTLSTLQSTARSFPGGSSCNTSICGSGIVDAAAAVAASITFTPTDFVYMPAVMKNWPPPPPGTLYSVADSTIMQGYPTANFGSTVDMWAGYDDLLSPDGMIVRSLVKFDLSAIPTGTSINSAVLQVYYEEYYDFPNRLRTVTAYGAGSTWSELSVTWNNQPSIGSSYGAVSLNSNTGAFGWYSLDVTNLVRGWINGTSPNHGIVLRGPEVSGADSSWRGFYTRESSFDPYLAITYSSASVTDGSIDGSAGFGASTHTIAKVLSQTGSNADQVDRLCGGPRVGAPEKCLAVLEAGDN
jgi:serine protease